MLSKKHMNILKSVIESNGDFHKSYKKFKKLKEKNNDRKSK